MSITSRFKKAWNAFNDKDKNIPPNLGLGTFSASGNQRARSYASSSIVNVVFNRIALDASMTKILHVKEEKDGNQVRQSTSLQDVLSLQANIDQTGMAFMHDLVYSLLDEGVIAAVPVETTANIRKTLSYDIISMRVGSITQWYPEYVTINLYNDKTGNMEEITLPKASVAIIQNPLYEVVNARNSALERLKRKMALLDRSDEKQISDKLNLIMQLPYGIKSETRRDQANKRLKELEEQLAKSQYGIGYIDGTEKITQLTHPLKNNLSDEVKYLTEQFYNSIGLTQNIFNGTASESEMRSYYNRTIDPIVEQIVSEFNRKFITKTARSQGQKLVAYRDPFELVPVEQLANIADTFSRNAILTPNEIRSIIGFGPNDSPQADELSNKNIADVNQDTAGSSTDMGQV